MDDVDDEDEELADPNDIVIPPANQAPRLVLVENDGQDHPPHPDGVGPDKIIIYLAWPSLYGPWSHLLSAHSIPFVQMTGAMSAGKKAETLKTFEEADVDGPRVLLMSKVGLFGHNISCANILIMVVSYPFPTLYHLTQHKFDLD